MSFTHASIARSEESGPGGVAVEYGEQQLAEAIAAQGGLGIANLVANGLYKSR